MNEAVVYVSGSGPVDTAFDALGNLVANVTTSAKLLPALPVNVYFGSALVNSANFMFIADGTYQVAGATGYPTVLGSGANGCGVQFYKVSGNQYNNPTVVGGIPLLTNSLNFTTSTNVPVRGSLVNSAPATQLALGDMIGFIASYPAAFIAGASGVFSITLNKI